MTENVSYSDFSSHEEEEEETILSVDVSILHYNPKNPANIDCDIKGIFDFTYSAILLHNGFIKKGAYELLLKNRNFFEAHVELVFWITHLKIFFPNSKRYINDLTKKLGLSWGKFCFPFETNKKLIPPVRELFFKSVPYFYTQIVQHIYIKISHGSPTTTSKDFRLTVCSLVVTLFTSIQLLDSQLEEILGSFFEKAPPIDLRGNVIEPKKENTEEDETTLLPTEDLSTLIETQRKHRLKKGHWNLSGISSLISVSANRKTLPFEHDSKVMIEYPEGGKSDIITKLPPLLPPSAEQLAQAAAENSGEKYDPNNESRSLLQRSRRPFLASEIVDIKTRFQKQRKKQMMIDHRIRSNNSELRKALLETNRADIDCFLRDLRILQLENKRNVTPDLVMFDQNDDSMKVFKNYRLEKTAPSTPRTNAKRMRKMKKEKQKFLEQDDSDSFDEKDESKIPLFDPNIYIKFETNL